MIETRPTRTEGVRQAPLARRLKSGLLPAVLRNNRQAGARFPVAKIEQEPKKLLLDKYLHLEYPQQMCAVFTFYPPI